MGKLILILFITLSSLNAKNIYEENCVSCHNNIPVSIDKYFYRYLLKYSSESRVKKEMFWYLKEPLKKFTIMPDAFISRFGIKKPTTLSEEELKKAIDIYWEKYKVFGKLK